MAAVESNEKCKVQRKESKRGKGEIGIKKVKKKASFWVASMFATEINESQR